MGWDKSASTCSASLYSQNWRATASSDNVNCWRRKSSVDSGYESSRDRSTTPPLSRPRSLSNLSQCTCHQEYIEVYRSYKEQEKVVRRWLCSETRSELREPEDLDKIDLGGLMRMANIVKNIDVPFSVAQALRKAISGRKSAVGRWHHDEADHTCEACGRLWRKADDQHKHHISELERMQDILSASFVKAKVDPLALSSWR